MYGTSTRTKPCFSTAIPAASVGMIYLTPEKYLDFTVMTSRYCDWIILVELFWPYTVNVQVNNT